MSRHLLGRLIVKDVGVVLKRAFEAARDFRRDERQVQLSRESTRDAAIEVNRFKLQLA